MSDIYDETSDRTRSFCSPQFGMQRPTEEIPFGHIHTVRCDRCPTAVCCPFISWLQVERITRVSSRRLKTGWQVRCDWLFWKASFQDCQSADLDLPFCLSSGCWSISFLAVIWCERVPINLPWLFGVQVQLSWQFWLQFLLLASCKPKWIASTLSWHFSRNQNELNLSKPCWEITKVSRVARSPLFSPVSQLFYLLLAKLMRPSSSKRVNTMGPSVWVGNSPPQFADDQDSFLVRRFIVENIFNGMTWCVGLIPGAKHNRDEKSRRAPETKWTPQQS